MIKRPRGRCVVCREPAVYGQTHPLHCESHRNPEDLNWTERPCVKCALLMVLDDTNHCEYCHPIKAQTAMLVKQREVMSFLDVQGLPGTQTDRMVEGGECGKERPDRVYDLTDRVIILEVDEHQHRDRACECEQTRMVNVSQSFGGRPVQWVRYNPDIYHPHGSRKRKRRNESADSDDSMDTVDSPSTEEACQQPRSVRMRVLTHVLRHAMTVDAPLPTGFVTALYLFFDGWKDGVSETAWKIVIPWSV